MDQASFIINNRYRVDPAHNSFQDRQSREVLRLEPRLMAVLAYLGRHPNQLVTREELVEAIWANYGGGDEGLSQAICWLRKLLDDRDRQLIRTIPKKGYVLSASISTIADCQPPGQSWLSRQKVRQAIRVGVALYVLVTASYFIFSDGFWREPHRDSHYPVSTALVKSSQVTLIKTATGSPKETLAVHPHKQGKLVGRQVRKAPVRVVTSSSHRSLSDTPVAIIEEPSTMASFPPPGVVPLPTPIIQPMPVTESVKPILIL